MAITRREFLLAGVATGAFVGAGVVLPVAITLTDDDGNPDSEALLYPRKKVGSLSGLGTGEPVFFDYPLVGQSNLLVKMGKTAEAGIGPDADVVAFSNLCTHMGCPIEKYEADHGVLGPCPCHFTTFDLAHDGQVTLGQATEELPRVLLTAEGDDIYAVGVLRLVYGYNNTLIGGEPVA